MSSSIRWEPDPFPVEGTRSLLRLPEGTLLAAHVRPQDGGVAIFAVRSRDQGRTWEESGLIASDPEPDTDIGDGALLRIAASGAILYTYRHNHHRGRHARTPSYAIRVAISRDGGTRWEKHSTVTEHTVPTGDPPSRGLWAPFLFETPRERRLLCVYDDEKTPFEAGFRGHQWLMARAWDPRTRSWQEPTVVSRAAAPRQLSRDGMGTVVAVPKTRLLLCALESVQTDPPHANLIRSVVSGDEGRTWSWQKPGRATLYQPADPTFGALCPSLIRLADGTLACVFCTDEDQDRPSRSGTPPGQMRLDVKLVTSRDGGRTWSAPQKITDSHRTYLPGMVETRPGALLATWMDFARDHLMGRRGTV